MLQLRRYLFHQPLGQQVFNELSQVLSYHSLMEESHPAVHQPDDGGSAVSSQLVGQTTLITQVHNTNAHTWCSSKNRLYIYTVQQNTSALTMKETYNLKQKISIVLF